MKMNNLFSCRVFLTAFAVLVLLSSASCSDRKAHVKNVLVAADSLMMTEPRAALDTLMGLDSSLVVRLGRKDRALYALLKTEAEYKCYRPVDKDTAVFEAVKYFKRNGPKEKYARAMIMKGVVYRDQGDTWEAMRAYKAAEPVMEEIGDFEQLGLLHTRIGELYQSTYVYAPKRIEWLKSALHCFEIAGKDSRAVTLNYALASSFMAVDSTEEAYGYIVAGMKTAEALRDTVKIIRGRFLLSGYYYYSDPPDYYGCRKTALSAIRIMDKSFRHTAYYNELYYLLAASYAGTGDPDSAGYYLERIQGEGLKTKIRRHSIESRIALLNGDPLSFFSNKVIADSLYYNEIIDGYEQNLYESEMEVENKLLKEQYEISRKLQTIYALLIVIILLSMTIIGFIFYNRMRKLKYDAMKSGELLRLLDSDGKKKEIELSEIKKLSDDMRMQLGNETSAKEEWIGLHENMLKMEDSLLDAYYRYGTTNSFSAQVKKIIDKYFPAKQTNGQVIKIVNLAYPGFLDSLRLSHSALTGQNIYLIALIACGFSTGAICAIFRCSENTLNVSKTRIAKKLGIEYSLSTFITNSLHSFRKVRN